MFLLQRFRRRETDRGGSDAILDNGAYTQAAWREITSYTVKLENPSGSDPKLHVEKRT